MTPPGRRPQACPNCGDDFDRAIAAAAGRESDPDDYDRFCHIGTAKDEQPGWRFFHGVSNT